MTNKEFGTRKERELKDYYEKIGHLVTRAGGSLGMFDLIAISDSTVRLIQVKATHGKYLSYKKDLEDIKKLKVPFSCIKIVAEWKNKQWEFINIK